MPFCPSCGNELSEDALFCQKCGSAKEGPVAVVLSRRETLKRHLLWGGFAAVGLSATVFAMIIMLGASKIREIANIQAKLGQGLLAALLMLGVGAVGYCSFRWRQTYSMLLNPSGQEISTRTKVMLAVLVATPLLCGIVVPAAFVMGLFALNELEKEPERYRFHTVVHVTISLLGGIMLTAILGFVLLMIAGV
ncbi:MAG: zinc ribbon domain-containing protein [Candidatus Lernaella stagnicola]|nr:zinc ribbon domain-containing protein [Candidatus Lernaella stagnicola]